MNVQIGDPDLRLMVGAQEFLVECKCPFDWNCIVRSLKDTERHISKSGAREETGTAKDVIGIRNRCLGSQSRARLPTPKAVASQVAMCCLSI